MEENAQIDENIQYLNNLKTQLNTVLEQQAQLVEKRLRLEGAIDAFQQLVAINKAKKPAAPPAEAPVA